MIFLISLYFFLLLGLTYRNWYSPTPRPMFFTWLTFSLVNLAGWAYAWAYEQDNAMPALSLVYPLFFVLAGIEAFGMIAAARGYSTRELIQILAFSFAIGYLATSYSSSMPTQWNLLAHEKGMQIYVAQAYIGLLSTSLACLASMWRFHYTPIPKEFWRHALLLVGMLAIKVGWYAFPVITEYGWYVKSGMNFALMSLVLTTWCFTIRPMLRSQDYGERLRVA